MWPGTTSRPGDALGGWHPGSPHFWGLGLRVVAGLGLGIIGALLAQIPRSELSSSCSSSDDKDDHVLFACTET